MKLICGTDNMPRKNPFNVIYEMCNDREKQADPKEYPIFPRYIDIELTNICNFKCLMCPTGTGIQQRRKGFMSRDTFYSLIEAIKDHQTPIRFIGWGEPLLHPNLLEFLDIARKNGLITHLNTNGLLLTDEIMKKFVEIPLTSLKFSFQGVDRKSYADMRNRDFFPELIEKIKRMNNIRGTSIYPYIHVSSTTTYESPEQISFFKETLKNTVDLITIGKTRLDHIHLDKVKLDQREKDRLVSLMKCESVTKNYTPCSEVFNVLAINWDGTISACCADFDKKMVVGDISTGTVLDAWNSQKMNSYRALLSEMKHDKLEICRTCYDYMGLKKESDLSKPSIDK
jgi:radical SAM protein with 4Fe4S-binding SPASM domain